MFESYCYLIWIAADTRPNKIFARANADGKRLLSILKSSNTAAMFVWDNQELLGRNKSLRDIRHIIANNCRNRVYDTTSI